MSRENRGATASEGGKTARQHNLEVVLHQPVPLSDGLISLCRKLGNRCTLLGKLLLALGEL